MTVCFTWTIKHNSTNRWLPRSIMTYVVEKLDCNVRSFIEWGQYLERNINYHYYIDTIFLWSQWYQQTYHDTEKYQSVWYETHYDVTDTKWLTMFFKTKRRFSVISHRWEMTEKHPRVLKDIFNYFIVMIVCLSRTWYKCDVIMTSY